MRPATEFILKAVLSAVISALAGALVTLLSGSDQPDRDDSRFY